MEGELVRDKILANSVRSMMLDIGQFGHPKPISLMPGAGFAKTSPYYIVQQGKVELMRVSTPDFMILEANLVIVYDLFIDFL